MVCTADDADVTAFPLNTPILLTNVLTASSKARETGTLARTLEAIGDQIQPVTVVVRVAQEEDEVETTSISLAPLPLKGRKSGIPRSNTLEAIVLAPAGLCFRCKLDIPESVTLPVQV